MVGAAPAAVDLGWYIAVNASRLARSKDALLARYRILLTDRLGAPLAEPLWHAMEGAAVAAGARMLLWSKAFAYAADPAAARREWMWWANRLDTAAAAT